jgi:Xaa-Pro dipeptidase
MNLPSLPRQEFERRWRATQEAMSEGGLDLFLAYSDDHAVFGPAHVRYLANFPAHFEPVCVLVPSSGEPMLATGPETAAYAALVSAISTIVAIEEFGVPGEEYPYLTLQSMAAVVASLQNATPRRVGVAGLDQMSVATWERLRPAFGSAELVRADDLLLGLRRRKSVDEIAVLKYAFSLAQRAMQAALQACLAGAHEFEVAAAAEFAMRSAGAEGTAIDSIVAFGADNSRPIIARAGRRQLQPGDIVSLTFAARYEGYSAPIARVAYVGEPPAVLRKATEVALEAQRRSIAALRPGVACMAVDAAARSYLGEHGYAQHCAYGVGHSVGLQEFEPPFCGPSNREVLDASMVMSIDVPMFFGPWGGFRFEDAFLITEDGTEPLTTVDSGLITLSV